MFLRKKIFFLTVVGIVCLLFCFVLSYSNFIVPNMTWFIFNFSTLEINGETYWKQLSALFLLRLSTIAAAKIYWLINIKF